MTASFEEKSAWIQLAGIVLGLGAYFVVAGRLLADGVREMSAYASLFMVAVVAMVVFLVVGHIVAAVTGRPEGPDERDRLIVGRAEGNSSWIVAVGVLGGVTCMALGIENVWTANLLLLSLALAEAVGYALRIVYYRRGV